MRVGSVVMVCGKKYRPFPAEVVFIEPDGLKLDVRPLGKKGIVEVLAVDVVKSEKPSHSRAPRNREVDRRVPNIACPSNSSQG